MIMLRKIKVSSLHIAKIGRKPNITRLTKIVMIYLPTGHTYVHITLPERPT